MKKMKLGGIALAIGLLCFMGVAYGPSVTAGAPYQLTQSGSPGTVNLLGSSWDAGATNVAGGVCSPCGWQSLGNATGPINGTLATAHLDDGIYGFGDSVALSFSDFGLDVPSDATIDGIRLVIAADSTDATTTNMVLALSTTASQPNLTWSNSADASWYAGLNLLHTGGWVYSSAEGATGNEITYAGDTSGLSAPYNVAGGPTELWSGSLSPAIVSSSNFGVVTHSSSATAGGVLSIDGMTMTVFYTTAAAAPTATGWVLGLLGIAFVLAAAFTLRKRALPIALALALAMVFTGAVAGAQDRIAAVTTTWDGLANGADATPLTNWPYDAGVWTQTATGYDITGVLEAGCFILPDNAVSPQDWRLTATIDTADPLTEFVDGWASVLLWGPSGPLNGSVGIRYAIDGTAFPGEIYVSCEENPGDYALVGTGVMTLRIERVGNTVNYYYTDPGTMDFNLLSTWDLAAASEDTFDGEPGLYLSQYSGPTGTLIGTWSMGPVVFEAPPAAAATATITRSTPLVDPFTTGTASWDVVFSEAVSGVDVGQFTPILGGSDPDVTGATVLGGTSPNYTIEFQGVTGLSATIGVQFTPSGAVTDDAGSGIPVGPAVGSSYSNIVGAPTANNWVLVFMGIVLALAATAVIRKRALDH